MNIQKAREERRSFYAGESKEHGTFSIASAHCMENFICRRNADEVSWNHLSAEEQTQFSKAIETEWQGVLDFKAVTILDSTQADVNREKQRERVISSRLVLRWKETDTGYKAKADGAGTVSRILTSTRLSAVAQRQSCRPSTLHCRSWRRLLQRGRWPTGGKAFMQGDPSVRDEPLYATPPPEGLPGVPEGALIRLHREVYGLVSGMLKWRSRIVFQLKEEGYEMNVYEPCLFSKFAVREEPAVDGGSSWLCVARGKGTS